MFRQFLAWWWK